MSAHVAGAWTSRSAASRTCRCSRAAASTVDGPPRRGLPPAATAVRGDRRRLPARRRPAAGRPGRRRLRHLPAARPALRPAHRRAARRRRRPSPSTRSPSATAALLGAPAPRRAPPPRRAALEPRDPHDLPLLRHRLRALAEVAGGRAARGRAATRCTPSTAARPAASRCGCPSAVARPDRATRSLRPRRALDERWRSSAGTRRSPSSPRACASCATEHGPDAIALLHLRAAADRGLLRGQQAGQGLPRDQQRRLQLAPVHVLAPSPATRGAFGSDGPPPGYADLDAGRLHPAARLQHRRLPPDRVGADPRAASRRARRHRRRPAPHADRRGGRPAPAGPARHRPAAAERDARTCIDRDGLLDRDVPRAPHDGIEEALAVAARVDRRSAPPTCAASPAEAIVDAARRFGAAHARDGAVVDGRQPVDAGTLKNRAINPLPGDRQHRP